MHVDRVGIEPQPGELVEDELERHPQLHAREVDAEAHVVPLPEREVRARRAEDVELVGVVPARRVAVGVAHAQVHRRARRDRLPTELGVGRGDPPERHERGLPPQPFLDRLGDERSVAHEGVELVGMRQEREEQVGERAVGGLRARGHEQPHERDDLVVAQALALPSVGVGDLGVDQDPEQVSARFGAPVVDEPLHQRAELVARAYPPWPRRPRRW